MYSPMSYVSLHLIFFWSHPHSKFQMNEIVFLTTIFHSIHLLLTCSTAGLTDPKAYCVVASPRTSGYTSRTAVSLWWNAGGISTRSRYQAPSNAWWKCLSSDSESSDFFSRKINNSELHMKLTFETLQSNQNTWWAQPWPVFWRF